jgi:hypothetical protein
MGDCRMHRARSLRGMEHESNCKKQKNGHNGLEINTRLRSQCGDREVFDPRIDSFHANFLTLKSAPTCFEYNQIFLKNSILISFINEILLTSPAVFAII